MSVTISVIDNKIRVTTTGTNVDAVITKYIISSGILTEQTVETLEDITNGSSDSAELEDGVYQIVTNDNGTQTNIAFILSQANEQKAVFQIETIKTTTHTIQTDIRSYYDLLSFCIHYDILAATIASYVATPVLPFNAIEIVQMFDNLPNYYKQ